MEIAYACKSCGKQQYTKCILPGIHLVGCEICHALNSISACDFQKPLDKLKNLAKQLNVLPISNVILEDNRFPIWSGSSGEFTHHYGNEQLAQHTWEVVELCFINNKFFATLDKQADEKKLFLAALFHDAGKMWDYSPLENGHWTGNKHKKQVYHLVRSAIVWSEAAKTFQYDDKDDEILHAILAHHGQRIWGSPVSPATRMAWLLHLCDSLSARMDDCYKDHHG